MPRDTTVIAFRQPEAGGARRMLAQVLIAEADSFIAMWKDLRLPMAAAPRAPRLFARSPTVGTGGSVPGAFNRC